MDLIKMTQKDLLIKQTHRFQNQSMITLDETSVRREE